MLNSVLQEHVYNLHKFLQNFQGFFRAFAASVVSRRLGAAFGSNKNLFIQSMNCTCGTSSSFVSKLTTTDLVVFTRFNDRRLAVTCLVTCTTSLDPGSVLSSTRIMNCASSLSFFSRALRGTDRDVFSCSRSSPPPGRWCRTASSG